VLEGGSDHHLKDEPVGIVDEWKKDSKVPDWRASNRDYLGVRTREGGGVPPGKMGRGVLATDPFEEAMIAAEKKRGKRRSTCLRFSARPPRQSGD